MITNCTLLILDVEYSYKVLASKYIRTQIRVYQHSSYDYTLGSVKFSLICSGVLFGFGEHADALLA